MCSRSIEDELSKENYRPVGVLSHACKIFEKIVFNQLNLLFFFFETKISQESQHAIHLIKYD